MALSVWLGFYIVIRSARSRLSWVAALTLWSLATYFLHNVIAVNLPRSGVLAWLRPVPVLAFPLLLHLTIEILPDKSLWWAWGISPGFGRVVLIIAYAIALVIAVTDVVPGALPPATGIGDAAYLSGRQAGRFYALVPVLLVALEAQAIANLWRGRSHVKDRILKQQFSVLLVASTLAVLVGLYITLGVGLQVDLPTLPGDVTMGVALVMLGYAIARYNAFVQVRTFERDLAYATVAIGLLTLAYYSGALLLYHAGQISFFALMLTILFAVSSHALYDGIRFALDHVLYEERFRRLRANLNTLAREVGTGKPLEEQLQAVLRALCRALRIRHGYIALRTEDHFVVKATRGAKMNGEVMPNDALATTEITDLPRPGYDTGMDEALLVPLSAAGSQLGALVLGPKESRHGYEEADLELLDDLADQIASVIHASQLQMQNAQMIDEMVNDFRSRERTLRLQVQELLREREKAARPAPEGINADQLPALVEDGLRQLYDFTYLGQHALAQLSVVDDLVQSWDENLVTHIDRGRALNTLLQQAVRKLRPDGVEPQKHQIPPREWHQYIILHDAYVLDIPNRDIMSRLYISEGTFNRTRRRAIQGVAQALMEMDQAARETTPQL
jgi:GAF domain-containing protein